MIFPVLLSILASVTSSRAKLIQPSCYPNDQVEIFYNIYSDHTIDILHNWICREDFEQKLKICSAMYMAVNRRPFTTTHKVVRDSDNVSRECQRRNITFWQYDPPPIPEDHAFAYLFGYNESEEADDDIEIKNLTIDVNLFKCPITKMDFKFFRSWTPIDIFDLYIITGRNDVTVTVLRDSMTRDNICVIDTYFYSGNEDIQYRGLYLKP